MRTLFLVEGPLFAARTRAHGDENYPACIGAEDRCTRRYRRRCGACGGLALGDSGTQILGAAQDGPQPRAAQDTTPLLRREGPTHTLLPSLLAHFPLFATKNTQHTTDNTTMTEVPSHRKRSKTQGQKHVQVAACLIPASYQESISSVQLRPPRPSGT
jgi:hypothetical protein